MAGWYSFGGSATVSAHAVQITSSPAPNEQFTASPESVTINFSEPIEPAVTTVQLWDTSPAEVPVGGVRFPTEDAVTLDLPELAPGIYTVIWRNLSTVDGHTWSGSFSFTVLLPGGAVPEGSVPPSLLEIAQPPSSNPDTLDTAARWIILLGSAVMLGGTAYALLVALPATRVLSQESATTLRSLSKTVLVVTGAIAIFLVLQGSMIQLLTQATDLGGLGTTDELLTDTRSGKYLIVRQALLLVALLSVALVWRSRRSATFYGALGALLVAAFGVLFTQSMVSHAAASEGEFWTISADFLHLAAASLWVGGLIHAGIAMPRLLEELRDAPRTLFAAESFRLFSLVAAFSVIVIMVSGVLSAFAQFTSFGQLFDTSYGWSLVAKMGVMLPLLIVAGLNAFVLQPRIVRAGLQMRGAAVEDGPASGDSVAVLQRLLVNTVRIEAVLGIVVLVAVGVLTQVQPARAGAAAAAAAEQAVAVDGGEEKEYFLEAAQAGGLVVSLRVDPAQVGQNTFEVGLGSQFGTVGQVLLVRLEFDHEDSEIGSSRLELPLTGSARYEIEASNLSLPGEWDVIATIRRRGEDDITAEFTVPVGIESGTEVDLEPEAKPESSIWDWPFDGARSTGAVITLAAGGAALAGAAVWQLRALRRRGFD